MTTHTATPWHIDPEYPTEIRGMQNEATTQVADVRAPYLSEQQYPNAARIVACVNACEGIEDPRAFLIKVRGLLNEAISYHRLSGVPKTGGADYGVDLMEAVEALSALGA